MSEIVQPILNPNLDPEEKGSSSIFKAVFTFVFQLVKFVIDYSAKKKREKWNDYVEKRNARVAKATFNASVDSLAKSSLREKATPEKRTPGLTSLRSKS